ncbi:MAG: glucokinase [Pseudomonadales bacterium]
MSSEKESSEKESANKESANKEPSITKPLNQERTEERPQQRCLLADIGATNARFALTPGDGSITDVQILPTQDLGDGASLLPLLASRYDFTALDGLCLALAGPVIDGNGRITNGSLALRAADLQRGSALPVLLLNDFYALAHAVPFFRKLHQLGGTPVAEQMRAVLGPGSGLGMSLCLPEPADPLGWRILPSEGGYADLAPSSPLEAEVLALLQQSLDHVCWETVLSGPGLVLLYRTLATIWGDNAAAADSSVSPAWITAAAADAQVPLCHQTLELFFSFLGAAAGNLALTGYARGGVYIAGGIVPRLLDVAKQSPLRRRFEERGALTEWVSGIPLYLVADEHPGLLGAAVASRRLWL